MADLIYFGIGVLFFVVGAAYVAAVPPAGVR